MVEALYEKNGLSIMRKTLRLINKDNYMQQLKQEKMKNFIKIKYITLSELAGKCNVDELDICKLETAQCIPRPSYEVRTIDMFSSLVAEDHIASTRVRYYHPSIINLTKEALALSEFHELTAINQQLKVNFRLQLEEEFKGIKTPGCQNFDQAWSYWVDGTWGICLKELTVECMAKKELSRLAITNLMKYEPDTISEDNKIKLTDAINVYLSASMDFPVYGIRHILPQKAIEKFQLEISLGEHLL
ncbi:MAG: hypothetical protein ACI8TE_000136 [Francisella sp.]|jgi:hypothetical protein